MMDEGRGKLKNRVGLFVFLLLLFPACGTPVATETVRVIQNTQTPSPIITVVPSVKPTSTLDQNNQTAKDQYGESRFCQVSPEWARFGSTTNVSVFGMPANDTVSIYIYDHQESATTVVTDNNGYINADLTIPMNANPDVNMVIVDGTGATTTCFVWLWSEAYLPTYYAGLTKTVTPTLSPEQIAITATQQVLHHRFDKYCKYSPAWGFRFSPNGQWVEVSCSWDTIEFVDTDETKNWEASADTLVNPGGDYFIGVDHWSNDGAYVYIDFDPHTDGYWEPFHQGIVLYRLDLGTGQISEVLPLRTSDWIFYSIAFSPNDRRLAYIATDKSPVILNIRDMQTGVDESFEFDPKYNTGGGFVWSPDSQRLVFSVTQFDTNTAEYIATSIILWDKDKSELTELIKDHQSLMQTIEWVDEMKIRLQAEIFDPTQMKTQSYEFDLASNQLTEVNP